MNMFSVEFYKEDGKFCAYIGSDNSSGYEIRAETIDDCAKQIADYFAFEMDSIFK